MTIDKQFNRGQLQLDMLVLSAMATLEKSLMSSGTDFQVSTPDLGLILISIALYEIPYWRRGYALIQNRNHEYSIHP